MIASASDCVLLHLWHDSELEQCCCFTTENRPKFSSMSWCHDNSYIGVIEENGRPLILSSKDRSNLQQVHTIVALENASSMAFKHSTKRILALASHDGDVAIYDTKLRVLTNVLPKLSGSVSSLEYNSNDQQLGILSEDCLIILYDVNQETEYNNQFRHKSICSTMRFNPVLSNQVAVGCVNGSVVLWDTNVNAKTKQYQKHSDKITGLALTGCGKTLLTCGMDYKVSVIDNTVGDCIFRLNLNLPVTALDLSPDDKFIALGLNDGSIYMYDIRNYIQPLVKIKAHDTAVNMISFENGPRETSDVDRPDFTANPSSISFNDSELKTEVHSIASNRKLPPPVPETIKTKSNSLERVKKDILRSLRTTMDDLEHQLLEHCNKFQEFLNNEFDAVHDSIRDKWELFTFNDGAQVNQLLSYCNDKGSVRSTVSSQKKK